MGAVEEVVEMYLFDVRVVVNCQIRVGGVKRKLVGDPFQGALSVVFSGAKNVMVPVAEVCLLLVKDMQLLF